MKKKYLQIFVNTVDKDTYTLDQLYDEYKYFCEQNVIPKNTKTLFRQYLEFLDSDHVKIHYDDNLIKIKSITII